MSKEAAKDKDAEAQALMKSAKKLTTKSITRWSVSNDDWNSGAQQFEKAAKLFCHTDNVQGAVEAWRAASNAHDKAGNGFFAGKCLENLAQFLNDAPKPSGEAAEEQRRMEVTKCYIEAGQLFALANKPERQAESLAKAASTCSRRNAPEASKLMKQALDTLEETEKYHWALDLYRALLLVQVRGEMWAEAIQTLKRQNTALSKLEQPGNASKCGLEIVVIALYSGDWVLADREFKEATEKMYAFAHSREQRAAYELIAAVDERDQERLTEAIKDQTLTFITADISRMAKKIKISGFGGKKETRAPLAVGASSAPPTTAAKGSPGKPAPQPVETADDEDDIKQRDWTQSARHFEM